ncbi:beta-galactosidase [Edaphobacter aggregans]|uniref:beta-galactosidase n=1 Tax=Edaphobacter aggregans TaxID=570835 RepID=UPI000553BBD6|nr:beta-galactosidase [Edaphobacter aggregans]
MIKRILSALLALASLPALAQPHHAFSTHVFSTDADHFTLDGKSFKILSGELHYARIPREYWHARLKMARAMGLNTIATYVFWNVHELTPGHFDFTGNNGLAAFIRAAQEEGLYVKPGDTFLDSSKLGKGALWINGHAIGRFWNIGPLQTLYVPGPWLKKGENEIVIFDLMPPAT